MSTIAEKIKSLRVEKGLTQKQLAQQIGFAQSVICDWENEKVEPTSKAIIALCKYFEISSDYLLGLENEDGSKNY